MAEGDVTLFNEFLEDLGEEVHDFANDTIKLALIDDTVTPLADTDQPRWDASSSQDYDGHEVSDAGGYTAGGITIPVTFTRTTDTVTLDDNNGDVELDPDPAGFDDARWGILYNSSATNKNCICFIDFGSSGLDETAGAVRIYWNSSGIFTISGV